MTIPKKYIFFFIFLAVSRKLLKTKMRTEQLKELNKGSAFNAESADSKMSLLSFFAIIYCCDNKSYSIQSEFKEGETKNFFFPRNIIQTSKDQPKNAKSWTEQNEGWNYIHFNDNDMISVITKYLLQNKHVNTTQSNEWIKSFLDKMLIIEKADLFRYIAIYEYGGVYIDDDVLCKVPIEEWLDRYNTSLNSTTLGELDVIVGIEFTYRRNPNPLQLVQWTFAAKQHNLLIQFIIDTCISYILNDKHHGDVVQRTGPGMFTHAILKYLLTHALVPQSSQDYRRLFSEDYLSYPSHIIYEMRKLDRTGQILTLKDANVTIKLYMEIGTQSHNNLFNISLMVLGRNRFPLVEPFSLNLFSSFFQISMYLKKLLIVLEQMYLFFFCNNFFNVIMGL
ncbi:hypothetical protein RFI_21088 [Reticulomyxa filosa]|uniref:Uncharacterized protein n=1 Tax=Reticulomyxa filosa TaxID=46433 RepID=X6MS25_RETFI|nr:hypothetical protein RFI_21088 [Reticulomyxa filosa]|eukprot:ETO16267.1 hypothetical protein RFI_21088 [Reticulomyxa filosa]